MSFTIAWYHISDMIAMLFFHPHTQTNLSVYGDKAHATKVIKIISPVV